MTIDELDRKTQAGFKAVQTEFAAVRAELRAEIAASAASVTANVTNSLRAEIKAEGEVTRRHFDVVAEQFRERTRLLADGTARNRERLDNHETRIAAIETQRPSR